MKVGHGIIFSLIYLDHFDSGEKGFEMADGILSLIEETDSWNTIQALGTGIMNRMLYSVWHMLRDKQFWPCCWHFLQPVLDLYQTDAILYIKFQW